MTIQLLSYIHILQVEALWIREGDAPAQCHTENLVAKEPEYGWVSHPPICQAPGVSSHPHPSLLARLRSCLFLHCVDKVSSQLGVGSVRSGAGRGSAGEGHGGR